MGKVLILSGPSGCGKTTWVSDNVPTAEVVSTDSFFYDITGAYNFDPSKLGEYHSNCLLVFINNLRCGTSPSVPRS